MKKFIIGFWNLFCTFADMYTLHVRDAPAAAR